MAQATKRLSPAELAAWFEAAFGDTVRRLNWSTALKAVAGVMEYWTKENFDKSHAPDGIPWKPLSMERPRNVGKGTSLPLRDKGILMASLTSSAHGNAIRKITGTLLEFGTNVEYSALHQYGGVIRPKNAKALTIPLTREAVTAGRAPNFPRDLFVVWPKGKPHGWLAEAKQSKKGKEKLIFHYLLVSKSTIPARPFLGFNAAMLEDIKETIRDSAIEQIES